MKPIEINPVARTRPVGSDVPRAVSGAPTGSASATTSLAEPDMVTRSEALSAGAVPSVDTDRVAQIRTAIQDGSYPLVPASVADAMIAAEFILIDGKKDQ